MSSWRLFLCFAVLAPIPVLLVVRLWSLQVQGGVAILRPEREDGTRPPPLRLGHSAAQRQTDRNRALPAPRGSILDRKGRPMAADRPVVAVFADVAVPRKYRKRPEEVRAYVSRLAVELASRLAADPDKRGVRGYRADATAGLEQRLGVALKLDRLPDGGEVDPRAFPECWRGNILVHGRVGSLAVLQGLRDLAATKAFRQILRFEEVPAWHREYLERDATWGVVGVMAPWQPGTERRGVSGLEALAEVKPLQSGAQRYSLDAKRGAYWRGGGAPPDEPAAVRTTLDLRLQAEATRILEEAATTAATGHQPTWGGIVLVEVATGDVLAMASWHQKHGAQGSLVPLQNAYEPGSVVKPLVFAWALHCSRLDWHHTYDCIPRFSNNGWRHPEWSHRRVHDDHRCEHLTPHGILMNSSNIGAVQVGMQLEKPHWDEYIRFYQWAVPTALGLPAEAKGSLPRKSDYDRAREDTLREYTLPSLAIGYGINASPAQIARAYLSMLSGRQRSLRLVQSVESRGGIRDFPQTEDGERVFSPLVTQVVVEALKDVVSPKKGATGRLHLWPLLEKQGIPQGFVAGKSGTAESKPAIRVDGEWKKINVRNASFVAFAPADAPRYLAVCVLQKERTERFYGGRYAAPAAGRLLLRALREDGFPFPGDLQVSDGSPVDPAGTGESR